MRKAKTTMAVIALAVLPLQAGAQAVDPSCHQVTLDRINAQKKEAGCPGFEGCDVLERYSALSARTVKEMEASNARYQQVWQAVANEKAGELAAFQQQADDIKRRDQTLDITNKAEVRRLQDDKEAYNTQVGIATMKLVAPDRRFDEVNAANTRIQTTSNDVESQELVGRLAVGLPERVALQKQNAAAHQAIARLQVDTSVADEVLRTPAYTKALAAYAAAQSVAEMGTVDEKLEYAVATNAAAWEVRETFAQVQARSLSGGMTMERIGKFWGGSEGAGEMRQAIGPHSREALSAAAGKGIADIRISFGAARDARSVLLNKRPQVPPPIPPGDGSAVSKVEAFVSATKDAVAETAKKIKRRVSGAAIIKPAHDAN